MSKPAVSIITPVKATKPHHVQWLHEAVGSVEAQTFQDWEMVVVDDHSSVPVQMQADPRVRWYTMDEKRGASATRNRAAELAQADLLLPLDADDKLAATALRDFLDAWGKRGNAGIVYSDIVQFGQDYARVYLAPEYDFNTLMRATFMLVGCLHSKADWQRVGGWREDMELGLEDWEYWIALGELGVCGVRVAEPLYWYRRQPGGRLAALKADPSRWHRAYQKMRDIHIDSYNGRKPMGCCGGSVTTNKPAPARRAQTPPPVPIGNRVPIAYIGLRSGDFWVTGQVSRVRYHVPARGAILEDEHGRPGVDPRDVQQLVTVNRARDFKRLEVPKQPPPRPVPRPAPPKATPEQSEAWKPDIMVSAPAVDVEVQDPTDLSVREIKALDGKLTQAQAIEMLRLEVNGKGRSSVIRFLEAVVDELG